MKQKNKKLFRQGDVMLVEIQELPKNLKEKDNVLALGEVTGHSHRFESKQKIVFQDEEGQQFVTLPKSQKLVHEEHQVLEIPKGKYKVVLQREFDIVEGTRQVLD